jgi:thiamine monophosphate synthase
MVSSVEVRTHVIWLEDDGIVRVKVKPHVTITLEDAKVCVRTVREVCGGKQTPALIDMTVLVAIEREARLYFAGEETAKVETAAALLINSPVARAIGNIFMGLNKPIFPTRLFTSEAEALNWLKGFVR